MNRSRSPYALNSVITGGTVHYTSPPAPSNNVKHNSNSNISNVSAAAIPNHAPPAGPITATSNFVQQNSGLSMAPSPPLYPKFSQNSPTPSSPYTSANGQAYMLGGQWYCHVWHDVAN